MKINKLNKLANPDPEIETLNLDQELLDAIQEETQAYSSDVGFAIEEAINLSFKAGAYFGKYGANACGEFLGIKKEEEKVAEITESKTDPNENYTPSWGFR